MADRIEEALASVDGIVSGTSANEAARVRKHLATLRAEVARLRKLVDDLVRWRGNVLDHEEGVANDLRDDPGITGLLRAIRADVDLSALRAAREGKA